MFFIDVSSNCSDKNRDLENTEANENRKFHMFDHKTAHFMYGGIKIVSCLKDDTMRDCCFAMPSQCTGFKRNDLIDEFYAPFTKPKPFVTKC